MIAVVLRPVKSPFVVTLMFSTFLIVAPPKLNEPAVAVSCTFNVSTPAPPSIVSNAPRTKAVPA